MLRVLMSRGSRIVPWLAGAAARASPPGWPAISPPRSGVTSRPSRHRRRNPPSRRHSPRTWPRSSRRSARTAIAAITSAPSRWRPTSRHGSAPPISPLVASERQMPPWKPEPGVGPRLKHDQSLSPPGDRRARGLGRGRRPEGDPKDMPPPPQFATDWKLGTPDLILEPAEDFSIPASGPDTYRCFVIPTNLVRDAYISAIDFRPRAAAVVHHINAFIDTTRCRAGEGRGRTGARVHLVLRAGHADVRGPGLLGRRARAPPPARRHRPALAPAVRRDPPGPLPPHRESPRSTAPASASISRARRSSRRSTGATASNSEFVLPAGESEHRGQGELEHPRRHRGPGRLPPHAPAGARHADVGDAAQRPLPGPDQYPRLGSLLAEHLFLPEADALAQGVGHQGHRRTSTTRTIRAIPTNPPRR